MAELNEIAAIVLAAGLSRRFGSDKLIHRIKAHGTELPILACSLIPWLDTFESVTVVIRPQAESFCSSIEIALGRHYANKVRWVSSAGSLQGMGFSLADGIRLNHLAAGWLIGLGDMPILPKIAIESVREAIIEGAPIAAPFYHGRQGHPVGFSSAFKDQLLGLQGDRGAKSLLDRYESQILKIEINDAGIFSDIDTLDDLHGLPTKIK